MVIEKSILDGCKQHDAAAQSALYRDFAPTLFPVCLRYSENREDAEDLLQEGFITIYSKIDQYRGEGSFEGWMKKIIVNAALMRFRGKKMLPVSVAIDQRLEAQLSGEMEESQEVNSDQVKETITTSQFTEEELLEIISGLPIGYRMVFNLVVLEEMKHKEASRILGISESTSKSQLLRARKLIRKKLYEAAVAKKRRKHHENLFLLMFIDMNEDLGYIDNLMKDGLGKITLAPSTTWSGLEVRLNGTGNSSAGIAAKGITRLVKTNNQIFTRIHYILNKVVQNLHSVAILTVSSLISLTTLTQSTGPVEPNKLNTNIYPFNTELFSTPEESLLFPVDTAEVENLTIRPNLPKDIETSVLDTVRIPVRKIIYRKKQIIKVDTVLIRKEIPEEE
jgi:RNA polymerase sigma factor (sigma-70 family)